MRGVKLWDPSRTRAIPERRSVSNEARYKTLPSRLVHGPDRKPVPLR